MISGAVYREGIARAPDSGAIYVSTLAFGSALPAGAVPLKGANTNPPGKTVTADGELIVRFV